MQLRKDPKGQKQKIKDLEIDIDKLEFTNDTISEQKINLEQRNTELESDNTSIRAELTDAEKNDEEQNERITQLETDVLVKEREITQLVRFYIRKGKYNGNIYNVLSDNGN